MQYILTEEEYQNLVDFKKKDNLKEKEKLEKFCTFVANNLPIESYGYKEKQAWGCIRGRVDVDEWYCDKCPCRAICTYEHKNFSK